VKLQIGAYNLGPLGVNPEEVHKELFELVSQTTP